MGGERKSEAERDRTAQVFLQMRQYGTSRVLGYQVP